MKTRAATLLTGETKLAWVDGFLSAATCRAMLEELEFAFWRPSEVVERERDGSLRNRRSGGRVSETSNQQWFSAEMMRMVRDIERRLTRLLKGPAECYEYWQATRYRPGGKFDFHHDAGYWADEPAGERELTVLIYLEAPAAGGGTRFREQKVLVRPQAGRLLVWDNLLGGVVNPKMIHAGAPVRKGRKCILVTWVRQRAVRDSKQ